MPSDRLGFIMVARSLMYTNVSETQTGKEIDMDKKWTLVCD